VFDDPFAEFETFFADRLGPALVGPMSQKCRILAYQLTNLSDPTEFVSTIPCDTCTGDQPGEYMPTFLAAKISTYSANAGKRRQGRHYFSGIGVTLADDGNIVEDAGIFFVPIGLLLENNDPQSDGKFEFGIYSQTDKAFSASVYSVLRARIARLNRRQLRQTLV
jgi:hypothetical protein